MAHSARRFCNPAVIFHAPQEVQVIERGLLKPKPGEVVIRNSCSLISTGTELTLLEGGQEPDSLWGRLTSYPATPGYCAAGKVVSVGAGVERSWLGKRVSTCAWMSHAKFMRASVSELRLIHRPIEDEYAVFSTLAEIVMNGVRRARLQAGEAVVVYGLGLLGQLAVRFCRICGARPVIGVDISAFRRSLLPHEPAVLGVDPRNEDVPAAVKAATKGRLADAVFEVTGVADLIPSEFGVLREQGRFIVLSSPRGKTAFDFHDLCNRFSYTIIGAHNMSHPRHETADNPWTPVRNASLFFDWIADSEIDLRPLISHRQVGVRAPDVYRRLLQDRGQAMGVILLW